MKSENKKSTKESENNNESDDWKYLNDCPKVFIRLILPMFLFILVTNYGGFYICKNILNIAEVHYNFTVAYFFCSAIPALITVSIICYKTNPFRGLGFFFTYIVSITIMFLLQRGELIEFIKSKHDF